MYGTRSGMGTYIGWPICGKNATVNPGLVGYRGFGCACGCGGCCPQRGLGYFDTGWDISGWSYLEWGTVLLIGYMVMSTVFTTQRGYRKARRSYKRVRERFQ